jgi:hypothetical protein
VHLLHAVRRRRPAAAIFVPLAVLAASAFAAHLDGLPPARTVSLTWAAAEWRMPLDNWGEGRAWHATGPGGGDIRLFARTKTGFCNCFNGIADDTEIDRIGDVDLHGDNFIPTSAGEPTAIGNLVGRKRLFQTSRLWTGTRHVLSIVAASDCKAVVATLVSKDAISPEAEASAIAVLTDEPFRRWAADR